MAYLLIEFLDGAKLTLKIEESSDQAGLFSMRGDANQAHRYGYIARRGKLAVALNGDAGKGVERILLASVRSLLETA